MTRYFQFTVLVTAVLYSTFFFLPYIWQYIYSEDISYLLSAAGTGGIIDPQSSFPYIYSMVYVLSLLGLYLYKKLAKWLFCSLTAFNFLVSPYILGLYVTMYFDASIGYLLTLCEGALILMLFSDDVIKKLK
ncbi:MULTISPECIES: hypothetical protein [unclassified Pseudoalteromonas]|nr:MULTISPECIES: hypothetical protein [unclassified Pseudoalteromonas]QMW15660.1 hypothetical protein H3302_06185 [Pseudoalteromonas sp. MT33b]